MLLSPLATASAKALATQGSQAQSPATVDPATFPMAVVGHPETSERGAYPVVRRAEGTPTDVDPTVSTVNSSVSDSALASSPERKVFYAEGYWWVFWTEDGELTYSSAAGSDSPLAWTNYTPGLSGVETFSVWVSGDTVYYAGATGAAYFYYDTGTLGSDGTISWGTQQTFYTQHTTQSSISVTTDSSGDPWVAVYTEDSSGNDYVEVYEISGTSATLATATSGYATYTDGEGWVQVLPLPADGSTPNVAVLFSFETGDRTYSGTYVEWTTGYADGAWSWSIPYNVGAYASSSGEEQVDYAQFSATAVGDVVYVAGSAASGDVSDESVTGGIYFSAFTIPGTIADAAPAYIGPGTGWSEAVPTQVSISQGPSGSGTLMIFDNDGANIYYSVGTESGGDWTWTTPAGIYAYSQTEIDYPGSVDTASSGGDYGVVFINYEEAFSLDFADVTVVPSLPQPGVAVNCTPGTVDVNTETSCTATVTPPTPESALSGSVTFSGGDGAFSPSDSCVLSSSAPYECSVGYTPSPGSEGGQTIYGTYSGESGVYESNEGSFPITADQRPSSTSVSCPTSVDAGTSVLCTITVTDTDSGTPITPTGSAGLSDTLGVIPSGTSCTLTAATASTSSCTVTYAPASDVAGSDTVTASYAGDTDHLAASVNTPASVTVSAPPPSEVSVQITLDQFSSGGTHYGTPLSASNYFTVSYTSGGSPESAQEDGGTTSILVDQDTTVTISAQSSGSSMYEAWCLAASGSSVIISVSEGSYSATDQCTATTFSVGTGPVSQTYTYYDLVQEWAGYNPEPVLTGGTPIGTFPGSLTMAYYSAPSTAGSSDSLPTYSAITLPQLALSIPFGISPVCQYEAVPTTTVVTQSDAGQDIIYVASSAGFEPGDQVAMGTYYQNEEATILGVVMSTGPGEITLSSDLGQTLPVGTFVSDYAVSQIDNDFYSLGDCVAASAALVWMISGTPAPMPSAVDIPGASPTERWAESQACYYLVSPSSSCPDLTSSTVTTGGQWWAFDYFQQVEEFPYYTVEDGGSGYGAPTFSYVALGSPASLTLTTTISPIWVDDDTDWSASSTLPGSSSTAQWACTSDCSGTTAPPTGLPILEVEYTYEYSVTFGVSVGWNCPDASTGPDWCTQEGTGGNISPSGSNWETAGSVVTTTMSEYAQLGYVPLAYCPGGTQSSFTTDNPSDILIPTGCTASLSGTAQADITINGPGTVTGMFCIEYECSIQTTCPPGSTGNYPTCYADDTEGGYAYTSDPAYVLITGPDGVSQVGCNEDGTAVNDFEGAMVTSCAGGTESILVTDPVVGTYLIQIFAVGSSSSYHVDLDSFSPDGGAIQTQTLSGTVVSGSPVSYSEDLVSGGTFTVSASGPASLGIPQFPLGPALLFALAVPALIFLSRRRAGKQLD